MCQSAGFKSGCKYRLSDKIADKSTHAWTMWGQVTSSRGPNDIYAPTMYVVVWACVGPSNTMWTEGLERQEALLATFNLLWHSGKRLGVWSGKHWLAEPQTWRAASWRTAGKLHLHVNLINIYFLRNTSLVGNQINQVSETGDTFLKAITFSWWGRFLTGVTSDFLCPQKKKSNKQTNKQKSHEYSLKSSSCRWSFRFSNTSASGRSAVI